MIKTLLGNNMANVVKNINFLQPLIRHLPVTILLQVHVLTTDKVKILQFVGNMTMYYIICDNIDIRL